ncbi:MAG: DUF11 domain-containing protein [Gammaproteobacteria bacterium]|nr:DUF11 domain-containing protein [Gammaproteobacteria bacterium]
MTLANGGTPLVGTPPVGAPAGTPAGTLPAGVHVRIRAEVERLSSAGGRTRIRLVPADRVVAGDTVVYTLSVQNDGPDPVAGVDVTTPIPARMRYLPGSAVGPGAVVEFSVDGGHSYQPAAALRVSGADGKPRAAVAADYTDIRWTLQDVLHAGSVAFLRYRAALR